MSAKRWSICPRCREAATKHQVEARKEAEAAYGKVSREAYAELVKLAETEPLLRETLREDWGLGIDDRGEFYIRYRCLCDECGFEHSFKRQEMIDLFGNKVKQAGQ